MSGTAKLLISVNCCPRLSLRYMPTLGTLLDIGWALHIRPTKHDSVRPGRTLPYRAILRTERQVRPIEKEAV